MVAVTGAAIELWLLVPPSCHGRWCHHCVTVAVAVADATIAQPLLPTRLLLLVSPSLPLLLASLSILLVSQLLLLGPDSK